MTDTMPSVRRRLLLLLLAVGPFLWGCSDLAPPTTPLSPAPSPPVPPPAAPAFPALSRPGEIYYAPDDLYQDWSAFHGGNVRSRYVLYDDGAFGLQFASRRIGLMEYHGRYVRQDSLITFTFLVAQGPPSAVGRLRGDSLHVVYTPSLWDDFYDGVYVRQKTDSTAAPVTVDQIYLTDANAGVTQSAQP